MAKYTHTSTTENFIKLSLIEHTPKTTLEGLDLLKN